MELKNLFGIRGKLFNSDTAEEIWKTTVELLKRDDFSVCNIIRRMNVKVMCTTDDPIDTLEHHETIKKLHSGFVVVPTFRPDKALDVENPVNWNAYRAKLELAAGISIKSFGEFIAALEARHEFFHSKGSRATDHAIVYPFAEDATKNELEKIFAKLLKNEVLSEKETLQFKTAVLYEVGRMNRKRGWVMQLHINALRNNNTRKFKVHGPDSGWNSIGDYAVATPLARFLDMLDRTDELPKTVLFTLNQTQNDVLATMTGNFMDGTIRGKLQFGPAWWFNDQKDGIERHLISIANMGMMALFIGMVTDAASIFALIRHEYFRRIICNVIGTWIEQGELPHDIPHMGGIVKDICFNNAMHYFGVDFPKS